MDEFEKMMDKANDEKAGVEKALIGLFFDLLKYLKSHATRNLIISVIAIVISGFCIVFSLWSWNELTCMNAQMQSMQGQLDTINKIFEEGLAIEETTTTETTTVTQDTGEGSGNNVYQGGEGSSYTQNDGGAE